ncbi:MAG TPA: SDR family oxidoreductase [Salinibacter sp.]|nr:SDR family oxidoreductase [Salinibacter sp.]
MNILVTGHEGYIGSRLVPHLQARGHKVRGFDTNFYTDGRLYDALEGPQGGARQKDIRRMTLEDLSGMDAVVHLAELSNDPLSLHSEENTYAINHEGSVHIAELCKEAGIERFVYTSSCSVYGVPADEPVKDETSETHPQTAYAVCKTLVERDLSAMADDTFSPTFLRNGTAYGPSPRQRFDIVLNNLAGYAWTTGVINMTSDGSPWRPMVHVDDICQAIRCALEAPREAIHNEVFNVGATDENYTIRQIAEIVAETFTGCKLSIGSSDGDNRSYRVNFDKIHSRLPGFAAQHTLADGAQHLKSVFEEIAMDRETFDFRAFTRLKQLKYLVETGQIDDEFFWADVPSSHSGEHRANVSTTPAT